MSAPFLTLPHSQTEDARRHLLLTARCVQLMDAFAAAGVPVLPLKGPVLAETLYDDPSERPFADLDFLVRREDVPKGAAVLEGGGFTLQSGMAWMGLPVLLDREFEVSFSHPDGTLVDLHWDTAPRDYPFRFPPEVLWSHMGQARIAGRDVPNLSPESLLLFLCVHGTKHAWSRKIWVRDVEKLVGKARVDPRDATPGLDWPGLDRPGLDRPGLDRPGLDWDFALALSERAGCLRPVLLGVLLAHEMFAARVPTAVVDRARAIPAVSRAAAHVICRLATVDSYVPSGIEMIRFNARLTPSGWAAFKHYAAVLRAPTEADARVLRLPRALFFLYYPFRLVRLAGKYGFHLFRFHAGGSSSSNDRTSARPSGRLD